MGYAQARTSNLNEELGQIKYVFSDKTGTLTQNVMEYKKASIAGVICESDLMFAEGSEDHKTHLDFMALLTVCHTVIPEKHEDGTHKSYNASSPDDRALVEGASDLGFSFHDRQPLDNSEVVHVNTPNGDEKYEILNIIEFTSSRKRMSVIAR